MALQAWWADYSWPPRELDLRIHNFRPVEDLQKKHEWWKIRREIRLKHKGGSKILWRRERTNQRAKLNHNYRLSMRIRQRINKALRRQSGCKAIKTSEVIGCSIEELRTHLERQFTDGMSWDNYGKWHIDHIVPCIAFDLTQPGHQKRCFHFSNLQPLWAEANLRKSAKVSNLIKFPLALSPHMVEKRLKQSRNAQDRVCSSESQQA